MKRQAMSDDKIKHQMKKYILEKMLSGKMGEFTFCLLENDTIDGQDYCVGFYPIKAKTFEDLEVFALDEKRNFIMAEPLDSKSLIKRILPQKTRDQRIMKKAISEIIATVHELELLQHTEEVSIL